MRIHGPERLAGQGLDPEQFESGNRAIHALLADPKVGSQVDLVLTWRAGEGGAPGAYEIWSARGLVRFQRVIRDDGALGFEVLEVVGENPVANQDPLALATLAEEKGATPVFSAPSLGSTGYFADDARWFPSVRHDGKINFAFIGGHVLSSRKPLDEPTWRWDFTP